MLGTDGKVVVVTGASSGIGEAVAVELGKAGATVVLGARRIERLRATAEAIEAEGGTARPRELDVTDRGDFEAFVAAANDEFGRVDVLVNNAGVMPLSPLRALKTDEWDRMIDVNIRGVLNGIAAVLPLMERRGQGHVVNVASVGAYAVSPTAAVYCATKYAVRAQAVGDRPGRTLRHRAAGGRGRERARRPPDGGELSRRAGTAGVSGSGQVWAIAGHPVTPETGTSRTHVAVDRGW